jgi:hypothetical protein
MRNALLGLVRAQAGRSLDTTAGIIDRQSVESSPQAIDPVGSDGGKKVKGRNECAYGTAS